MVSFSALGLRGTRSMQRALAQVKGVLLQFPAHLREREFWLVQGGVIVTTGLHVLAEQMLPQASLLSFHHIPVIFYIVPIAYASIRYGWEGGSLTSIWVALLVVPSIAVWHRDNFMWLGELSLVATVIAVGVTLASRVEAEGRLRRRAEAVSARLAKSEAGFRSLFETAGDAILVFNRQGLIVAANPAAGTLLGVQDPERLVGQRIGAWIPAWNDPLVSASGNGGAGANRPARLLLGRSDGRELLAEAVVTVLPRSGTEAEFQVVLRDATQQEVREKGLRSLVHRVTQAQEDERARIARDLHDDTLQTLMLLSRELESAADGMDKPDPSKECLRRLATLATATADDLRRFCRDLRPSILDDLGLVPAIEWLTADLAHRTGLETHVQTQGATRRLPPHVELALFRIAQEALRNVERHARASTVDIVLAIEPSRVLLRIADNGVGFAAPANPEELIGGGRLGLAGLKERASLVGGNLDVRSAPGQGTEVVATIPS